MIVIVPILRQGKLDPYQGPKPDDMTEWEVRGEKAEFEQEGEKMTNKLDVSRRANQKLERQLKSLKKYLSELPTRDQYKKLQV